MLSVTNLPSQTDKIRKDAHIDPAVIAVKLSQYVYLCRNLVTLSVCSVHTCPRLMLILSYGKLKVFQICLDCFCVDRPALKVAV